MSKTLVLDTNVLLYDTECLTKFKDNTVIIPLVVIEELDLIKNDWRNPELAQASREVTRNILDLDEIIGDLKTIKDLRQGISYESTKGGQTTFKIVDDKDYLPENFDMDSVDSRIIFCAKTLGATLVTRDNNMVLKASGFCDVEFYYADSIKQKEVYKGYTILEESSEFIQSFVEDGRIINTEGLFVNTEEKRKLYPNEFLILRNIENPKYQVFGICKGNFIKRIDLDNLQKDGMILKPKGLSQKLAMYLILDPDIEAVSFLGGSGTGKTSISVDFGLNAVRKQKYNQLYYVKSLKGSDEDEDYGFVPGDLDEKMQEVVTPLTCTLELLEVLKNTKTSDKIFTGEEVLARYREDGTVRILPLRYLRGMTISNKVVVLDEGQNLTIHKMKTLVTRIADNSKLIITGDDNQIDDKNLNKFNNGLAHFIENGKEEEFIAHITLDLDETSSKRGRVSNFGNRL